MEGEDEAEVVALIRKAGAYQTFGEFKDIVSPAQCQVIKLLTQIICKQLICNDVRATRLVIEPRMTDIAIELRSLWTRTHSTRVHRSRLCRNN